MTPYRGHRESLPNQVSHRKRDEPMTPGTATPQQHKTEDDVSIGKACFRSGRSGRSVVDVLAGLDLMGGKIVHTSFDCPKNLREWFKRATKANNTSMCPILQSFMVTYVEAALLKKACFSNTQPIVVENLVVPSYVKRRLRRGKVTHEYEVIEEVVTARCGFCEKEAVACFRHVKSGRESGACPYHAESLRGRKDWVEVKA